uniref:Olfactory receptor n=1 Tax=Sphenodon punctatus TaxID=8508 RepID=A0A8D0GK06_SPHPU
MGGEDNMSLVTEFILLGASNHPRVKIAFFLLFLLLYLITLVGNGLLILLTKVDSRLHTPMYFFLSNLSFLDICFTTSTMPQILVHCFSARPSISFGRCFAQMYISMYLGMTECLLLAAMAYDRWVAICNPLRYMLIMNKDVCVAMAAVCWGSAFLLTIVPSLAMPVRLCGPNIINHFACEALAVLKLVCSDTRNNQIVIFVTSSLGLVLPFSFILVTYTRIMAAVMRMHSVDGRAKAFSTCGSHLIVVVIFYGTAMFMYLRPQSKSSSDQDKIISVFYGSVTPMLNPLIYSLRNKDVKQALKKLTGGEEYHITEY